MARTGTVLFDTAIGPCGLAWRDQRVVGVEIAADTPRNTAANLARRFPGIESSDPRGNPRRARDAIRGLLSGSPAAATDVARIELDFGAGSAFQEQVYRGAQRIRPGRTLTYGELADAIGAPRAVRAVGTALGRNPLPLLVPCHRVLAAGRGAGGFSAVGGLTTKHMLLKLEGADRGFPGLEYDPLEAAAHLAAADARLARVIDQIGPPKITLRRTSSVFLALARAIVYQQLSGKAAGTIFGRVLALVPRGERGFNAASLTTLSDQALRGAGLSNNKMLALRDLAERSLAGEIPGLATLRKMDDAAIIETLTQVRGIGRWTVEMMLMYRLGRADIMAVDDLGLRQGHALLAGRKGETPRASLARAALRWRPYRSVASWYLWRVVELSRGQ